MVASSLGGNQFFPDLAETRGEVIDAFLGLLGVILLPQLGFPALLNLVVQFAFRVGQFSFKTLHLRCQSAPSLRVGKLTLILKCLLVGNQSVQSGPFIHQPFVILAKTVLNILPEFLLGLEVCILVSHAVHQALRFDQILGDRLSAQVLLRRRFRQKL